MIELTCNVNILSLPFAVCTKSIGLFELGLKDTAKFLCSLEYFVVRSDVYRTLITFIIS